jgi:hypothetical protein
MLQSRYEKKCVQELDNQCAIRFVQLSASHILYLHHYAKHSSPPVGKELKKGYTCHTIGAELSVPVGVAGDTRNTCLLRSHGPLRALCLFSH